MNKILKSAINCSLNFLIALALCFTSAVLEPVSVSADAASFDNQSNADSSKDVAVDKVSEDNKSVEDKVAEDNKSAEDKVIEDNKSAEDSKIIADKSNIAKSNANELKIIPAVGKKNLGQNKQAVNKSSEINEGVVNVANLTSIPDHAWSGSGTASDPALISSGSDLELISCYVNAGNNTLAQKINGSSDDQAIYLKLANDVDLTAYQGTYTTCGGQDAQYTGGWKPIGVSDNKPFLGVFDGNEKYVNNMKINLSNTGENYGLFGKIKCSGSRCSEDRVKNVNINNGSIITQGQTYGCIGMLVGALENAGISNSFVTGSIEISAIDPFAGSGSYIGGFIGHFILSSAPYGDIEQSGSTVNISAHIAGKATSTTNDYLGGFVGYSEGYDDTKQSRIATFSKTFSKGYVKKTSEWDESLDGVNVGVGGFAGGVVNTKISYSYASGDVQAANFFLAASLSVTKGGIGGFLGYAEDCEIENSYASGNVRNVKLIVDWPEPFSSYTGGFAGMVVTSGLSDRVSIISNCYARGNVYIEMDNYMNHAGMTNYVGGFIGYETSLTLQYIYATGSITYHDMFPGSSSSQTIYAGGLVGYIGTPTIGKGSITSVYALNPYIASDTTDRAYNLNTSRILAGIITQGAMPSGSAYYGWLYMADSKTDRECGFYSLGAGRIQGGDDFANIIGSSASSKYGGFAAQYWNLVNDRIPTLKSVINESDQTSAYETYIYTIGSTVNFPSLSDSDGSYYAISTPKQLAQLSCLVNTSSGYNTDYLSYKLLSNIDMNQYQPYSSSTDPGPYQTRWDEVFGNTTLDTTGGWVPIGYNSSKKALFNFSGEGKYIKDLKIDRADTAIIKTAGLFGYVDNGTSNSIKSLGLENIDFRTNQNAGAVVGNVDGALYINQVYSTGVINFFEYDYNISAGGLVGSRPESVSTAYFKIENSYSSANINGLSAGGIVGSAQFSAAGNNIYINNCYATGAIMGAENSGGIVGLAKNLKIQKVVALNYSVSGSLATLNIHRILGNNSSGSTISDAYAWVGIGLSYISACGSYGSTDSHRFTNKGLSSIDGQDLTRAKIFQNFFYSTLAWSTSYWFMESGKIPTLKLFATAPANLPFHIENSFFADGAGSQSIPYEISTAKQLATLACVVNQKISPEQYNYISADIYYKLTADIDLSNWGSYQAGDQTQSAKNWRGIYTTSAEEETWYTTGGWVPIGYGRKVDNIESSFFGHFDGDGHTINYLTINKPIDRLINNTRAVSGLFGQMSGDDVANQITPSITNLKLLNVYITSAWGAGALVGTISGKAEINKITVEGGSMDNPCLWECTYGGAGGIAGSSWQADDVASIANISKVNVTISITSDRNGGIHTGGILGQQIYKASGASGSNRGKTNISEAYFSSILSAVAGPIGGIAGSLTNGRIENCWTNGKYTMPSGSGYPGIGGILGFSDSNTPGSLQDGKIPEISNSYSIAEIDAGNNPAGGIASIMLKGIIDNSVALNYRVKGADAHRILASNLTSDNSLSNNWAFYNLPKEYATVCGKELAPKGSSDFNLIGANNLDGADLPWDRLVNNFFGTTIFGETDDFTSFDAAIWQMSADKTPALKALNQTGADLLSYIDTSLYFEAGTGQSDSPYIIKTARQLAQLACLVNSGVKGYSGSSAYLHYKLDGYIDLVNWGVWTAGQTSVARTNWESIYVADTAELQASQQGWIPIGNIQSPFYGSFDGDGSDIEDLTIVRTSTIWSNYETLGGLFGVVGDITEIGIQRANIYNLGLVGFNISNYQAAGALAGAVYSANIENTYAKSGYPIKACYTNSCTTTSNYYSVGGLIGYAGYSKINSVFSDVAEVNNNQTAYAFNKDNVNNIFAAGGIVGVLYASTLSNAYSSNIKVSGGAEPVGGVAGAVISTNDYLAKVESTYSMSSLIEGSGKDGSSITGMTAGVVGMISGKKASDTTAPVASSVNLSQIIKGNNSTASYRIYAFMINSANETKGNYSFYKTGTGVDSLVCGVSTTGGQANFSANKTENSNNGVDIAKSDLYGGVINWFNANHGNFAKFSTNYWILSNKDKSPALANISSDSQSSYLQYITDQSYFSGQGTPGSPYGISRALQLAQLACLINSNDVGFTNSHYRLTQDIDLGDLYLLDGVLQPWVEPGGATITTGWIPIGTVQNPFSAPVFDGQNHTISNLVIQQKFTSPSTDASPLGLFGAVGGANLHNIYIQNSQINLEGQAGQDKSIGLLAGYVDSTAANLTEIHIFNSSINVLQSNTTYIGAVAGRILGSSTVSTFEGVYLTIKGSKGIFGGLVGMMTSASISNSRFIGDIEVDNSDNYCVIGGVVGQIVQARPDFSGLALSDASFSGTLTNNSAQNSNNATGGIVGILDSAIIEKSYSLGAIYYGLYAGGLAGKLIGTSPVVRNSVALVEVIYKVAQNGFASRIGNAATSSASFDGNYALAGIGTAISKDCGIDVASNILPADGLTGSNGADVTNTTLMTTDFFYDSMHFSDYTWVLEIGKTPILSDFYSSLGPNTDYPDYIENGSSQADKVFSGAGTSDNPFLIKSESDLAKMACIVNKNMLPDFFNSQTSQKFYKLTKSLDLANWGNYSANDTSQTAKNWQTIYNKQADEAAYNTYGGWVPIGYGIDNTSNTAFFGSFDGANYTISNLKIDRSSQINSKITKGGLFGNISNRTLLFDATIKNLNLQNLSIANAAGSGGLVGAVSGQAAISKIYVTGAISHKDSALCSADIVCNSMGGVIGSSYPLQITNVSVVNEYSQLRSDIQITAVSQNLNDSGVGGIIGSVDGYYLGVTTKISQNYSRAQINISAAANTPAANVGGIAGRLINGQISDSYSNGSIVGNNAGGIVGYLYAYSGQETNNQVANTYSTATISTYSGAAGGIIGLMDSNSGSGDGRNYVRNNVALNGAIKADSGSDYHRIIGKLQRNSSIGNNWAFYKIGTSYSALCGEIDFVNADSFTNRSQNGIDGADLSRNTLQTTNFFGTNTTNWTAWDASIWNMLSNTIPSLQVFSQVLIGLPDYITTIHYFSNDFGNSSDPYIIDSPKKLAQMACLVNAGVGRYNQVTNVYRLDTNIDLASWQIYSASENPVSQSQTNWKLIYGSNSSIGQGGWVPIGNSTNPFKANFDGNGQIISNIVINRVSQNTDIAENPAGLFGRAGKLDLPQNIYIKNLGISNVQINNYQGAGSLIGVGEKVNISKTWVNSDSGYIKGCVHTDVVQCSGSLLAQESVGGLIGSISGASTTDKILIEKSFASVQVIGHRAVGGLVGMVQNSQINNSYSTGKGQSNTSALGFVTAKGDSGGIAGYNKDSELKNLYSTASVSNSGSVTGGLVGKIEGQGSISNSVSLAGVVAGGGSSRIVSSLPDGAASGNYAYSTMGTVQSNDCGEYFIEGQTTFAEGKTHNGANGADVSKLDLLNDAQNWFGVAHANFTAFDSTIWNTGQGNYGKLTTLLDQTYAQKNTFGSYIAENSYFEGQGTSSSPFEIESADELAQLACLVNFGKAAFNSPGVQYQMKASVDLVSKGGNGQKWIAPDGNEQTNGWIPIGNQTNPFKANFDGNSKTISNLGINDKNNGSYIGLFGNVNPGSNASSIANLGLINSNIKGTGQAGALAGASTKTTLKNIWVKGSVESDNNYVGGVVGNANNCTINDLYYSGNVVNKNANVNSYVGGIAGNSVTTNISRVYFAGIVQGRGWAAGITNSANGAADAVVSNSLSLAQAVGGADGKTVRVQNGGAPTGNYARQNMGTAYSDNTCGRSLTLGKFSGDHLHNNANGADVSDSDLVDENSNWFAPASARDNWANWTSAQGWTLDNGKIAIRNGFAAGVQDSVYPSYVNLPPIFENSGSQSSPYTIDDAAKLVLLACLVNSAVIQYNSPSVYYRLTADISLNQYGGNGQPWTDLDGNQQTEGWVPIGNSANPFEANFTGSDSSGEGFKTISDLAINSDTASQCVGLFGCLQGTDSNRIEISNLGLQNVSLSAKSNNIGLLAGSASKAKVKLVYALGAAVRTASDNGALGGLIGKVYNDSVIEDAYFSGNLSTANPLSDNTITGGIAGDGDNTGIYRTYTRGNIAGGIIAGGLVGRMGGESTIQYSVSLPLVVNAIVANRVVGQKLVSGTNNVNMIANYAFSSMGTLASASLCGLDATITGSFDTSTKTDSGTGGANVLGADLSKDSWFTQAKHGSVNWSPWDTSIWSITDTTIPVVYRANDLAAQDTAYPSYLVNTTPFDGDGTAQNPYEINSEEDLAQLACLVNNPSTNSIYGSADAHYILNKDLDLSDWGSYTPGDGTESETNWKTIYDAGSKELADSQTGWIPIGTSTNRFLGTFDGNSKKISSLKIARPNVETGSQRDLGGLFGWVGDIANTSANPVIKNLGLDSLNISNYKGAGGLVGSFANGDIQNVYTAGQVLGCQPNNQCLGQTEKISTGGLVGNLLSGNITLSFSSASVAGYINTGGLIGLSANGSSINKVYTTGNVVGGDSTGGIIGRMSDNDSLKNSYTKSQVSGADFVGGIVGQASSQNSISQSVALNGKVAPDASGQNYHRILGGSPVGITLSNNWAWDNLGTYIGDTCGLQFAGGNIRGATGPSEMNGKTIAGADFKIGDWFGSAHQDWVQWSSSEGWTLQSAKIPVLTDILAISSIAQNDSYPDYITWPIPLNGNGANPETFRINTASELASVACIVNKNDPIFNSVFNKSGVIYQLENDISLSAYQGSWTGPDGNLITGGWVPIGSPAVPFLANFDGFLHTISDLTINRTSTDPAGLFGAINGSSTAKIQIIALGIRDVNITTGGSAGILSATGTDAILDNIWTSGNITTNTISDYLGGIVGSLIGSSDIDYCFSTGVLSALGAKYMGGLFGQFSGAIDQSFYIGNVLNSPESTRSAITGGLVGQAMFVNSAHILNSYFKGEVSNNSENQSSATGGIAGYVNNYGIQRTYTLGFVNGKLNSGGIVGAAASSAVINSNASFVDSVSGDSQTSHRVVGQLVSSGPTLTGNYALQSMGTSERTACSLTYSVGAFTGDKTHTSLNGADVDRYELYTGTGNWFVATMSRPGWSNFQNTIWKLDDLKVPVLPNAIGIGEQIQIKDYPTYITEYKFFGGFGTEGLPYQISTPKELAYMACLININEDVYNANNVYYSLTQDIDLSDWGPFAGASGQTYDNWASIYGSTSSEFTDARSGWLPIGTSASPFKGVLTGKYTDQLGNITYSNVLNLEITRQQSTADKYVNSGLLGATGDGSQILYMGVIDVSVSSYSGAAGLVEKASGTIIANTYTSGVVNGCAYSSTCTAGDINIVSGGLVGSASEDTQIETSYSTVTISGFQDVGGLAGALITGSSASETYASGEVAGSVNVGGLVGRMTGAVNQNSSIQNSYSSGNVTAAQTNAGGIVGSITSSNNVITSVYAWGDINAGNNYAGGIVGASVSDMSNTISYSAALSRSVFSNGQNYRRIIASGTIELINNYAVSNMGTAFTSKCGLSTPSGSIPGTEGLDKENGQDVSGTTLLTTNFFQDTMSWSSGSWQMLLGKRPILLNVMNPILQEPDYPGHISEGDYFVGEGLAADPFIISSARDLAELSCLVDLAETRYNAKDVYYKISDLVAGGLDLTNYGPNGSAWTAIYNTTRATGWLPIGSQANPFLAQFDGNYKTISKLTISSPTSPITDVGLFGYINGTSEKTANISDLGIVNASINSNSAYKGVFAGRARYFSSKNIWTTGTISGSAGTIGGIIGSVISSDIDSAQLTNSYSNVTVSLNNGTSGSIIGGIVGSAGPMNLTNLYTLSPLYNNVFGTASIVSIGGIAGSIDGASLTNSAALNLNVNGSNATNYGRIVGQNNSGTLSQNYAWQDIGFTYRTVCEINVVDGTFPASSSVHNGKNGASVDSATFKDANINWFTRAGTIDIPWTPWTTADGWQFADGSLPILSGFATVQTNSYPAYIAPIILAFAGDGTSQTPFAISTANDLALLSCLVNSAIFRYNNSGINYKLENSLSLSSYKYPGVSQDQTAWIPIGTNTSSFTGTFDGQGNTISDLTINSTIPNATYGLFGSIKGSSSLIHAKVSNLYLDNLNISSSSAVTTDIGGLSGNMTNVDITQVLVMGNITSSNNTAVCLGGITCSADNVQLNNSFAKVNINYFNTGLTAVYAGGIAGKISETNIRDVYSIGNISNASSLANSRVGGIVGTIKTSTIRNAYTAGYLNGYIVGGIAADSNGSSSDSQIIDNNLSIQQYIYASNSGGRIVGNSDNIALSNNYAWERTGRQYSSACGVEIIADPYIGGTVTDKNGQGVSTSSLTNVGYNWFAPQVPRSDWNNWTIPPWIITNGTLVTFSAIPAQYQTTAWPSYIFVAPPPFSGTGQSTDAYILDTPEKLVRASCLINNSVLGFNNSDTYYELGANISLLDWGEYNPYQESVRKTNWEKIYKPGSAEAGYGTSGWVPIGIDSSHAFLGNFDGKGYQISKLSINKTSTFANNYTTGKLTGLFGNVVKSSSAVELVQIKNIKLTDTNILANNSSGVLAGFVDGSNAIGGVTISNIYVTSGTIGVCESCTVAADTNVGGIVGSAKDANIDHSFSNISINNSASSASGGIAGQAASVNITNSYTIGSVAAGSFAGGLVGRFSAQSSSSRASSIINGYTKGQIISSLASGAAGGIVGSIGPNAILTVNNVYSLGNAAPSDQNVSINSAGIVGWNYSTNLNRSSISNAVALGQSYAGASASTARIFGGSSAGATTNLSNNYAWDQILVNSQTIPSDDPTAVTDGRNGASIDSNNILGGNIFWSSASSETIKVNFSPDDWHIQGDDPVTNNWLPVLGAFGTVVSPIPGGFDSTVLPNTIGSQDGNAPASISGGVTVYHSVTFSAGSGTGGSASYILPDNTNINYVTLTGNSSFPFSFTAPEDSDFEGWCTDGNICATGNIWSSGQYLVSSDITFTARYVVRPSQIGVGYSSEELSGFQLTSKYVIDTNQNTDWQTRCVNNDRVITGRSRVPLSDYGLPLAAGASSVPILYISTCGSGSSVASPPFSVDIPLRPAKPDSTYFSVIAPQFNTQYTVVIARNTLEWSRSAGSCPSGNTYNQIVAPDNISSTSAGTVCLRIPANESGKQFKSADENIPIVKGKATPPVTDSPYIFSVDGNQSGYLYSSADGTPIGVKLTVLGLNLNNQGAKAGNIIVNGNEFSNSQTPYFHVLDSAGTIAELYLPSAAAAGVGMAGLGGKSTSLIIPSEVYDDSEVFSFSYVSRLQLDSVEPVKVLPQGSPVSITGDNFSFGDTSNISRVIVCNQANPDTDCKQASFMTSNKNSLAVSTPSFPNGTDAIFKITNLVGETTVSQFTLRYQAPNPNARLDHIWVPDITMPAGSQRNMQVIGIDTDGVALGDFGNYINSFNTDNKAYIIPGRFGGIATITSSMEMGSFNMWVNVLYNGVNYRDDFITNITSPTITNAFISPGQAQIVAQNDNKTQFKAFILNSIGRQIDITKDLPTWTVTGGGRIELDASNNIATFISDGTQGNFLVKASSEDYNGLPLTVTADLEATGQTGDYVRNVIVYPGDQPGTYDDLTVKWDRTKLDGLTGFKVRLYNTAGGVFREAIVGSEATNTTIENVFSGGYYATVAPIIGGKEGQGQSSDINKKAHIYLQLRSSNLTFTDNFATVELSDGVYWLSLHQVANGYPVIPGVTAEYKPTGGTTRGHMSMFFQRLAGYPPTSGSGVTFQDINSAPSQETKEAILWLASTGVSTGFACTAKGKPIKACTKKGQSVFRQDLVVNRRQMAQFIYKYVRQPYMSDAEIDSYIGRFSDKKLLTDREQRSAVALLVKYGITTGTTPTTYAPNGRVTRGQMALFMLRLAHTLEVSYLDR
jgi:hypothetical protein